jgi:hypothetical protein
LFEGLFYDLKQFVGLFTFIPDGAVLVNEFPVLAFNAELVTLVNGEEFLIEFV